MGTENAEKILGLTIHQPWAGLISTGVKNIENRTWKPGYDVIGSYIAIHASQSYQYFDSFIIERRYGIKTTPQESPTGAIVAVARLTEILTDSDDPWFYGPYGLVLTDVVPIQPIPCAGARRLWQLTPHLLQNVRQAYASQRRSTFPDSTLTCRTSVGV